MSQLAIKGLEHLFISKVRIKSLRYFTLNPTKPIHLRGAVREFSEEINAVRRELNRLEESKIITTEAKGNRKYFTTNVEHPFFNDLLSMFHKSYGLGGEMLANEKKLGEIEFAFLTPAYTRDVNPFNQKVDMVIVGDVDLSAVDEIVRKVQNDMGKEIHYMVMKSSDFQIRKRRRDQLIIDLLMQQNVMLLGSYEEMVK